MHKRYRISFAVGLAGLLAAACSAEAGKSLESGKTEGSSSVSATQQAMQGDGTQVTSDFPQVVRVAWGCTGTVIHRRFVLTAFHCGNTGPSTPLQDIQFTDVPGLGATVLTIDRAWSAGNGVQGLADPSGFQWGPDSALLRLTTPAPTAVTPAAISARSPATGQALTTYGYGAYEQDGDGNCNDGDTQKRRRQWSFPPSSNPYGSGACPGDSGGPTFYGASPGGDLVATTGNAWGLTSVTQISEELLEQIRMMLPDPVTGKIERWVEGVNRPGFDLPGSPFASSSPANCEKSCIQNDQCRTWSYDRGAQVCWLKNNVGRWVPDDTYVSGLRPQLELGFHRSGTPSFTYSNVGTARLCRAKCNPDSTGCGSFDYEPSTKACKWYSNVPAPVANSASATTVSGKAMLGIDYGMVRFASDYRWFDGGTATGCRDACAQDYDCTSYAYGVGGALATRCFLKNAHPSPYGDSMFNTGVKRRPSLPGYYLQGTKISGYDDYVPTPKSGSGERVVDMCAADCSKLSSCVAYTARHHLPGSFLRCTLYSDVSSELAIVDGDDPNIGDARQVTSGYRFEQFM